MCCGGEIMSILRIHKKLNKRRTVNRQIARNAHKFYRIDMPNRIWAKHRDLMKQICHQVGIDHSKIQQIYMWE